MDTSNLVLIEHFCSYSNVEISFVDTLNDYGLIEIIILDQKRYISNDHLRDVERALRFHDELNINMEGIDVIQNLLTQISDLRQQLNAANNRLRLLDLD